MPDDAEMARASRAQKHSPYFPVSISETPDMEKIGTKIGLVFIVLSTICNYLLAFFANDLAVTPLGAAAIGFISSFEPSRLRFESLQLYDGTSGFGYIFILLAGLFWGVSWGVLKAALYLRFVLVPGFAVKLDMRAAQGYFIYTLFLVIVIWALYFKNTELRDSLDMILLWPVFPAISTFGVMAIGWIVFTTIGGAAKIVNGDVG
jgi:hypothetical protein